MRTDRGETMLELLIAVVIMGIALVAIVGGIVVSVKVSDVHRKQSTAGTYARDYGEAIARAVSGGGYVACATPANYQSPPGFSVPSGFTSSVSAVRYWSGGGWAGSCSGDAGLQQLTVQVASDDGRATERVVIVVRNPCRLSDSPCPAA